MVCTVQPAKSSSKPHHPLFVTPPIPLPSPSFPSSPVTPQEQSPSFEDISLRESAVPPTPTPPTTSSSSTFRPLLTSRWMRDDVMIGLTTGTSTDSIISSPVGRGEVHRANAGKQGQKIEKEKREFGMVSVKREADGIPKDGGSRESMHGKEKERRMPSHPYDQLARSQSIQRIHSTPTTPHTPHSSFYPHHHQSIPPSSMPSSPSHDHLPVVSGTVYEEAITRANQHHQHQDKTSNPVGRDMNYGLNNHQSEKVTKEENEEEEDLGLYDVVANYSVGEIVRMHEKKRQMEGKKPTPTSISAKDRSTQVDLKKREKERREYSPISSVQGIARSTESQVSLPERPALESQFHPEWSSRRIEHALHQSHQEEDERKTLTIRRIEVLKKLYLDTLRDGDDFQYLKCMIAKLAGDEHGQLYLPSCENTPEDLSKLRAYLQSLDMTFEQIDEFLGDESQ